MIVREVEQSVVRDALPLWVAASWNAMPYDFGRVAEEKLFGDGAWGVPRYLLATRSDAVTGVAVISRSHLRILAVDPVFRFTGIGSELLRRSEELAQSLGARQLNVAGEAGNYFVPGIPKGMTPLRNFFERRGYEPTGEAVNLSADLRQRAWHSAAADNIAVERATQEEREEILDFITHEFGRLWAFEVSHAFDRDTPPLFIARDVGGSVIGFSAHDVNNRGLGFYGPAGVKEGRRGGGVGAALLRASLSDLADLGHSRAVIPWVSSSDFYRKIAGAVVEQEFTTFSKPLAI